MLKKEVEARDEESMVTMHKGLAMTFPMHLPTTFCKLIYTGIGLVIPTSFKSRATQKSVLYHSVEIKNFGNYMELHE